MLERIDHNTTRNAELSEAMLAILGEILTVLRNMQARLDDLYSLGESQQQALLQILDRLGPSPGTA